MTLPPAQGSRLGDGDEARQIVHLAVEVAPVFNGGEDEELGAGVDFRLEASLAWEG